MQARRRACAEYHHIATIRFRPQTCVEQLPNNDRMLDFHDGGRQNATTDCIAHQSNSISDTKLVKPPSDVNI
eukprot:1318462-Karenia_brevis.AAC.1